MKVDRVLMSLNNNSKYAGFWNAFSKVWKNKYNVLPTLIFLGSQKELRSLDLSEDYGEIYRFNEVPDVIVKRELDWSVTWVLYYATSLFPDDVCMTTGIDQLLLSSDYFDWISDIKEDKYVIGFADAYKNYNTNSLGYSPAKLGFFFPTSHHAAKGKTFCEAYKFEKTWEEEARKVFKNRADHPVLKRQKCWGLDETYSSTMLANWDTDKIVRINKFWTHIKPRRIERPHMVYEIDKLKNGEYFELHSSRPYKQFKKEIDELLKHLG